MYRMHLQGRSRSSPTWALDRKRNLRMLSDKRSQLSHCDTLGPLSIERSMRLAGSLSKRMLLNWNLSPAGLRLASDCLLDMSNRVSGQRCLWTCPQTSGNQDSRSF